MESLAGGRIGKLERRYLQSLVSTLLFVASNKEMLRCKGPMR